MKSVRELILDYLRKNRSGSAAELSQALMVTKADIRYHLKGLVQEGEIEKAAILKLEHKGRPTWLYRIAVRAQPENFMQIAEVLLSLHQAANTTALAIDQVVDLLAKSISPAKQRPTQLNRLVNYFNEHAYECRWEAHEEGPRIIFRNCPYDAILPGHPELCQIDLGIIEKYMGMHFQQVGKKGSNSELSTCIFLAAK